VDVFISWSGSRSKAFAVKLAQWLPDVIQSTRPFVSVDDIDKGSRWANVVAQKLETSAFGIIIVTKDTIGAPWLNFEAGALSRRFSADAETPVATLLLDISNPSDVPQPLGQFNATVADQADILRLLKSINGAAGEEGIDVTRLERLFSKTWADLKEVIDSVAFEPAVDAPVLPNTEEKLDEVLAILRRSERRQIPTLPSSATAAEDRTQTKSVQRGRRELERTVQNLILSMGGPLSEVLWNDDDGSLLVVLPADSDPKVDQEVSRLLMRRGGPRLVFLRDTGQDSPEERAADASHEPS
jgi:hypothetical protein